MILSRNMLKRVGVSRHPCRAPTVVRNQSAMLPLKRTALVALSSRSLMTRRRLALMLYFEGLLEVYEDMVEALLEIFLTEDF